MNHRLFLVLLAATWLGGCATTAYRSVIPGVHEIGEMKVAAGPGWNLAPSSVTPSARSTSRTWTQDGLLLDRLMLIPGVRDGEPIMESRDPGAALPVFRSDMLPNELEELVESTIVKLYGEGNAVVNTSNLRPHGFGGHAGVKFDFEAAVTDSPDYRGIVGAFIYEERLYMILFVAAEPHYFDKHRDKVEAIIDSVAMRLPTIRMS
jgi:hypothetical protein